MQSSLKVWCLHCFTLLYTALHCLNSSISAYIVYKWLGKVRTLWEWADALLSKNREWNGLVDGWSGYPFDCNEYYSTCGANKGLCNELFLKICLTVRKYLQPFSGQFFVRGVFSQTWVTLRLIGPNVEIWRELQRQNLNYNRDDDSKNEETE